MIKFNSTESFLIMDDLEPQVQPLWGKMSPQHMIEHLALTMKLSVGKLNIPLMVSEEEIPNNIKFLMSDRPLPKNFKGVIKSDELLPLKYKTLEEAKSSLKDAVAEFIEYYRSNPDNKNLHPIFGPLDKSQWIRFHDKHFTHHYAQFGLG